MADDDIKCEVLTDEAIKYDLTFKMIIIGDSGVGKSSPTLKATRNKFDDFYNRPVPRFGTQDSGNIFKDKQLWLISTDYFKIAFKQIISIVIFH